MSTNAVKTVADALKKSVAGDSIGTVKLAAAPHAGLGGGSGTVSSQTSTVVAPDGPFSFDYSKLDDLRKAYNANDAAALARLLPDKTTFVKREEIPDEELQRSAREYVDEKYGFDIEQKNVAADKSAYALEQQLLAAQKAAAQSGIWAILFVVLFFIQIRDGKTREEKYQKTVESLAEKLKMIAEVKAVVDEIKTQISDIVPSGENGDLKKKN